MGAASVPRLNRLITAYGKEGRLQDARALFDGMPEKNVYTWNALIGSHVSNGDLAGARITFAAAPDRDAVTFNTLISAFANHPGGAVTAVAIFSEMRRSAATRPDRLTLTAALKAAAALTDIPLVRQLHAEAVKGGAEADSFGASSLTAAYSKCGHFAAAMRAAAAGGGAAGTAAMAALCREGEIEAALELFSGGTAGEVAAWNTLMSGCVKNGRPELALQLFEEMIQRKSTSPWDERTLVYVISACSSLRRLKQGKQAHVWALKEPSLRRNAYVSAALVDFYRRCGALTHAAVVHAGAFPNPFATASMVAGLAGDGRLDEARQLYESTESTRSPAALTTLLSAYLRRGLLHQARQLLHRELSTSPSSTSLDEGFFVNLFVACAEQAELRRGKELHGCMVRRNFPAEGKLAAGLVDMYAKSGDLVAARKVFAGVSRKDLVLCNAMLIGFGRHGRGFEALQLFGQMKAGEGLPAPEKTTFLAVLSACGHAGLVAAGEKLFSEMAERHGFSPELGHYSSMVDLYVRAGKMEKAIDLLVNMPVKPDAATWGALLGACRRWCGGGAKKMVAEELLENSSGDGARFVQVANAFAEDGDWEEVERVRKRMKASRARRNHGGLSWVHAGGATVFFASGDGAGAAVPVLLSLISLHREMMQLTHEETIPSF